MDSLLQVFLICLVLGSVVGFLAGLLGIGGGLIIVPALLYILPSVGISSTQITHVAIATSLASIILTSMSSATAHHKRGNIPWELFKPIFPGIVIGSLASAFVSAGAIFKLLRLTNASSCWIFIGNRDAYCGIRYDRLYHRWFRCTEFTRGLSWVYLPAGINRHYH